MRWGTEHDRGRRVLRDEAMRVRVSWGAGVTITDRYRAEAAYDSLWRQYQALVHDATRYWWLLFACGWLLVGVAIRLQQEQRPRAAREWLAS